MNLRMTQNYKENIITIRQYLLALGLVSFLFGFGRTNAQTKVLLADFEDAGPIDSWQGLAPFRRTTDHASFGKHGLAIEITQLNDEFGDGPHPNVRLPYDAGKGYPIKNWENFKAVAIDVWMDGAETAKFGINVEDGTGTASCTKWIDVKPGRPFEAMLTIEEVLGDIDITDVQAVALYAMRQSGPFTITVDRLRLLPRKSFPAIGPYIQNVSDVSATICWATVTGEINYTPAAPKETPIHIYEHHSKKLRNLKASTTYTYDVFNDGTDLGKGTFTTAPKGEQPFYFDVIGDTQNRNNPNHRPIVEQIISENPAFVINVGDLVSDWLNIADWEAFFRINTDLMRSTPYFTVLGNHDRQSEYYFNFFVLPGNERYYSFNYGAAHFIVLDVIGPYISETDPPPIQGAMQRFYKAGTKHWQSQMEWLKQDLEDAKNTKYVFVFFHYPMYSANNKKDLPRDMRMHFGTIFQDYKVSAVFNGHNHNYHRAVAGNVTFVVTGVSGGRQTMFSPEPESVKYLSGPTHMHVDVGQDKAKIHAIGLDGKAIDEFEVTARMTPAR
jgi:acid phosphatase type 7